MTMVAGGLQSFGNRLLLCWSVLISLSQLVSCEEACDMNVTAMEKKIRGEMRGQLNTISENQQEILSLEKQRLTEFRDLQGRLVTKLNGIELKTELALSNVLEPDSNTTEFFSDLEEVKDLVRNLGENVAAIIPEPRSCEDVQRKREEMGFSIAQNGVYGIFLNGKISFAFCDFITEGGNWTVFQKRQDNSTNFFRMWVEFRDGFGHPAWNHWLGNEVVHEMTQVGNYTLRIEMMDYENSFYFIEYFGFSLGDESDMYPLRIGGVKRGNISDSLLRIHNGKAFGAKDKFRNYGACLNCPSYCRGGWWYECCYYSNLNGRLENRTENVHELVRWYDFNRRRYIVMKQTEMKLRPLH